MFPLRIFTSGERVSMAVVVGQAAYGLPLLVRFLGIYERHQPYPEAGSTVWRDKRCRGRRLLDLSQWRRLEILSSNASPLRVINSRSRDRALWRTRMSSHPITVVGPHLDHFVIVLLIRHVSLVFNMIVDPPAARIVLLLPETPVMLLSSSSQKAAGKKHEDNDRGRRCFGECAQGGG